MIGYGISGTTHDFFAYNAAGAVWNGSAFVTWADGSYASYRITATEVGTTGRFTGSAPSGTVTYELRERGASLALSYVVWTDDTNAATAAAQAGVAANLAQEAADNAEQAAISATTAATNTTAIKAKTDLIGTGTALVSAPVTDDGGLLELVIGDDYLAANGRALEWTFSEISGITTSAVGRFGLADAATGTEVYQNTSGTVTEPTAGTFKVSFDIPKAALASLPPGDYNWSVQVTEGSYCITLAKNRQNRTRVKLVTKQTTCS